MPSFKMPPPGDPLPIFNNNPNIFTVLQRTNAQFMKPGFFLLVVAMRTIFFRSVFLCSEQRRVSWA